MIRAAKISDYRAMDDIFRASAKALCASDYGSEVIEAWAGKPWPERFVRGAEDGDKQYVTVLEDGLVCFGVLNVEKRLLVSLFVSPGCVGKGVGQAMLEFLFEKARAADVKVLLVDSSLNAADFYVRNGFVEQHRSEFTTYNGTVLPSVHMECVLNT